MGFFGWGKGKKEGGSRGGSGMGEISQSDRQETLRKNAEVENTFFPIGKKVQVERGGTGRLEDGWVVIGYEERPDSTNSGILTNYILVGNSSIGAKKPITPSELARMNRYLSPEKEQLRKTALEDIKREVGLIDGNIKNQNVGAGSDFLRYIPPTLLQKIMEYNSNFSIPSVNLLSLAESIGTPIETQDLNIDNRNFVFELHEGQHNHILSLVVYNANDKKGYFSDSLLYKFP